MLEGISLQGRYRLDRRIGGEGKRAVFLATDLQTGSEVAIKVFPLAVDADREQALADARLRERAAAAARLRHPNLVTVHEVGTDEPLGLDFIVMELLKGEDLRQRKGRLTWQQASRVLEDAARALGAGHGIGLVHGGVRPANLFLEHEAEGKPPLTRVLDLAATRRAGADPANPYAAPEQRRGEPLTPAADVWSLAAVAYEILTGRVPFTAKQLAALSGGMRVAADAPSRSAAGIPPAADDLIARSLSPDPEQRPADAQAFARELDDVLRGVNRSPSPARAAAAPTHPHPAGRVAMSDGAPPAVAPVPEPPPAPEAQSAAAVHAPSRRRGTRMVLATGTVALVAVLTIAAASRSRESAEEYLAAARPIEAPREPRAGEIDHVKAVFERIDVRDQTIREWRMELGRLRRFEWPSSDSAHATVYEDQNGIQKIRVRTYENGERTLSLIFYYDYAKELVFVFEIRPSGGGRRAEQRFYFSDRALVRWRDTRNETVPLGPGYDAFATRLHRISDRLIEQAARSAS